AAVASIAFAEPAPVVDGNVLRVLRRIAARDLSDEDCWQEAERLLARRRPGDFNQAMMELGAMVCLPTRPLCGRCPVAGLCAAQGKDPTRATQPRRKASLNFCLARRNGSVLLKQRPRESSLMPLMWELPAIDLRPAGTPALR